MKGEEKKFEDFENLTKDEWIGLEIAKEIGMLRRMKRTSTKFIASFLSLLADPYGKGAISHEQTTPVDLSLASFFLPVPLIGTRGAGGAGRVPEELSIGRWGLNGAYVNLWWMAYFALHCPRQAIFV